MCILCFFHFGHRQNGLELPFILSDVNECTTEDIDCDQNAYCDNTEGNYTCTCLRGYVGNGITCQGLSLEVFCNSIFIKWFVSKKKTESKNHWKKN